MPLQRFRCCSWLGIDLHVLNARQVVLIEDRLIQKAITVPSDRNQENVHLPELRVCEVMDHLIKISWTRPCESQLECLGSELRSRAV